MIPLYDLREGFGVEVELSRLKALRLWSKFEILGSLAFTKGF